MSEHRTLRGRIRHALTHGLFIAAPLLTGQLACAEQRDISPPPGHPSRGEGDGRGIGITVPWGILPSLFDHQASSASAAEAPPSAAASTPEPNPDELRLLLADGPQFPQSRPGDRFEVRGLLKGGWPLVVDFMPAPGSCTYITVFIGDKDAPRVVIDPDGRQGRHLVRLDFPPGPPERPWPARYLLQSGTPSCPSGSPAASSRPSPLEVYGIGAGPRAVGSISVTDLHIGPPHPDIRVVPISYRFTAKWSFNRAVAVFLRYERSPGDGSILSTLVRSIPLRTPTEGVNRGNWDGLDDARHVSTGIHRLEVRAWDNQEDDNSWAGAISSDVVTITRP